MRKLKLRAWQTPESQMWFPDLYSLPTGPDNTLMQYTGLKDKNGVEIYEGDILAIKFDGQYIERVYWDGPPDAIAEVYWSWAGFQLNCHGERDRRYAHFTDFATEHVYGHGMVDLSLEHTEVIGNIYENPDLLPNAA